MYKNLLISSAFILFLGVNATTATAVESGVQNISNSPEKIEEKAPAAVPMTAPPAPAQAAEETYEQKAKALGNKIKAGFMATSKLPSVTACIAKGTTSYAGWTSAQDEEKAESITEMYLLMGKDERLDLSNQEAVYDFLVKKLDARIGQNVQAGAEYFGSSMIQKAGSCIRMAGTEYYKYRLKQALEFAFKGQAKE